MHFKNISKFITENNATLLGVGPMSKEVVDITIELANEKKKPICLIASRRQIDSAEFGGGYVESWTTDEFAKYVQDRDTGKYIILARDHGGPWQSQLEIQKKLGQEAAMESAKRSYLEDIKSGLNFIHIDTSIDPATKEVPEEEAIERLIDLYDFCTKTAKDENRDLTIEIGTEEQTGKAKTVEENENMLIKIQERLNQRNLPKPNFIVMQTGTRVISDRNDGTLDNLKRKPHEIPPEIILPQILNMCERREIFLKEHNLDYVSSELLRWHPRLGIHAANVAPEFGVTQTKTILNILEENGLSEIKGEMIKIAVESNKWLKWIDKENDASDERKAILCMHYVYNTEKYRDLLKESESRLKECNIELSKAVKDCIKKAILRYLKNFNY